MTGSGSAAGPTEIGDLRIDLRSVNGRGLILKQRLCSEAVGLEAAFEEEIRRRLQRGSVTLFVERTSGVLFHDRQWLQRQVADLRALARELGLADDLTLRDVLAMTAGSGRSDGGGVRPLPPRVALLLQKAIEDLVRHRTADGAAAVVAMQEQLLELETLRTRAAVRAPELAPAHRDKLLKRVNELMAAQGLQLAPADIVREVALFADRVDIGEELQRLAAHLAEVRALLAQGGELGRKLEFMLQELLREANTLGSKSPDVAMAHCVVAMKSCIDKLKEQAANLE